MFGLQHQRQTHSYLNPVNKQTINRFQDVAVVTDSDEVCYEAASTHQSVA